MAGTLFASAAQSVEVGKSAISDLQAQARQLRLADSVEWRRLVHYYPSSRSKTSIESHVDDERFFLASDGKTNPEAELLASIEQLLSEEPVLSESAKTLSIQCRFVARSLWLREKLDLAATEVPAQCTEFHDWMERVNPHTITLVFPASFLNSPSSMFGHTLLRIDPENIDSNSDWLSWSLNFAAEVGEEDSFTPGYAFKGIAGAFAGKFSSVPYFQKLQEYGAIENRDIWEYQLDLTPHEVKRLVMHAWELNDINFDYYFFRQNCSFRLLELIEWARPSLTLTDQFPLTAIPADTVKAVVNADIVSTTNYRPSLGTQLHTTINHVPNKLRRWVSIIEDNPARISDAASSTIDADDQAKIITAANDLLTYRSRKTVRTPAIAKRRLALLKHISQIENFNKPVPPTPSTPESAHETTLLSLGFGRRDDLNYTDLTFRASYHDLLDRQDGYLRGAGISLGELTIRRDENNDTRVQAFELVELQSISDRPREFNSLSWTLNVGLARDPLIGDDRLGGRVQGLLGKSLPVTKNTIAFALAGPSVNVLTGSTRTFFNVHANAGLLWYRSWGTHQFDVSVDSIESSSARFGASAISNFNLSTNHAIRLTAAYENVDSVDTTTIDIAYRFFF